MERIYLSKQEKELLENLCQNKSHSLSAIEEYFATKTLEEKGFVKGAYAEGGNVEDIRLLSRGKVYFQNNPKLRNPINWAKVSAITSMVVAVLTLISIFVNCIN